MKFIIEHGHTKREIVGPFNMCASWADFTRLHEVLTQLMDRYKDKDGNLPFSMGWIPVTEPSPRQESVVDTAPVSWD